jgi:hypothetical protein
MSIINISSLDSKLPIGSDIEIKFYYENLDATKVPDFFINDFKQKKNDKDYFTKVIKVIDFLGQGSYGTVYKIKLDDNVFAIKLSENELPPKLSQRYKSLCENAKLKKHIIKIHCCGEIYKSSNNKYKYYCIMEYGGKTLKSCINNLGIEELKSILKQLYNIVNQSCKYRILITDFKLGNLTLTSSNKVKLIDIYMECKSYSPCTECKIVKTYSTIELDKEKRIYESDDYNYTGMYIPLAVCLIDLICENSISHYTSKLCKKYDLDLNVKQIIPLLQIACFNFNNENNESIKQYKNIEKYKKNLENEYKCLKNSDFYEHFLNIIVPNDKFSEFISKKKFSLIINDLLTLDPDQRSLKYLKNKLADE